MRLCTEHWSQLRKAIDDRGLTALVAKDGHVAIAQIAEQLASGGEVSKGNYDPLMSANFAIWSNAIQVGGLYLMTPDENGQPRCPICESEKHEGLPAEWWITNAADEQLQRARELGVAPPAS